MQILIDKLFILIVCFVWHLFLDPKVSFSSVAAFFTAVGISCFFGYFYSEENASKKPRNRLLLFLLPILYVGICFLLPGALVYLPVIFYDTLCIRFYLLYPFGILACIFQMRQDLYLHPLFLPVQLALAGILYLRTSGALALKRQIKEIRDDSTEYNRRLAEKNRTLLEKQDYEIYLATLKERNRIAREIHDNVGHMLSRSILQSGALIAINRDENLTEPLAALKDTLNLAMNNIRESVHDLHDDSIDLKAVIEQLLTDYGQYQIQFDYDMGPVVARNVKYCFISITKEALSNAAKHSNATRLSIVMREHPSLYQLSIEDNGTKIHLRDSGIGLSNMRERVDALGGTLTIHTEKGFHIFISIPKN